MESFCAAVCQNVPRLVGEAISLPRSTGYMLLSRMGGFVPIRHLVPFNEPLRFPTEREADSLPY